MDFEVPNLGPHPCSTNVANPQPSRQPLKTEIFRTFSLFSNILFLLSHDVQSVSPEKKTFHGVAASLAPERAQPVPHSTTL